MMVPGIGLDLPTLLHYTLHRIYRHCYFNIDEDLWLNPFISILMFTKKRRNHPHINKYRVLSHLDVQLPILLYITIKKKLEQLIFHKLKRCAAPTFFLDGEAIWCLLALILLRKWGSLWEVEEKMQNNTIVSFIQWCSPCLCLIVVAQEKVFFWVHLWCGFTFDVFLGWHY